MINSHLIADCIADSINLWCNCRPGLSHFWNYIMILIITWAKNFFISKRLDGANVDSTNTDQNLASPQTKCIAFCVCTFVSALGHSRGAPSDWQAAHWYLFACLQAASTHADTQLHFQLTSPNLVPRNSDFSNWLFIIFKLKSRNINDSGKTFCPIAAGQTKKREDKHSARSQYQTSWNSSSFPLDCYSGPTGANNAQYTRFENWKSSLR